MKKKLLKILALILCLMAFQTPFGAIGATTNNLPSYLPLLRQLYNQVVVLYEAQKIDYQQKNKFVNTIGVLTKEIVLQSDVCYQIEDSLLTSIRNNNYYGQGLLSESPLPGVIDSLTEIPCGSVDKLFSSLAKRGFVNQNFFEKDTFVFAENKYDDVSFKNDFAVFSGATEVTYFGSDGKTFCTLHGYNFNKLTGKANLASVGFGYEYAEMSPTEQQNYYFGQTIKCSDITKESLTKFL